MRNIKRILIFFVLIIGFSCAEDQPQAESGLFGSTTRYAIQDHYLYVVTDMSLTVYDIELETFEEIQNFPIGFGVQTIVAKPGFLYMGANDGMHIYSLVDPENPAFIFKYEHILSCDPVVVQGDRAYVTLRGGRICGDFSGNALEIINISDPNNPVLIKSYPMTSPGGLAIEGDILFITEGAYGFKMFDVSDELNIKLLAEVESPSFDVIARSNLLTVTGAGGISQFQYTDGVVPELNLLSVIPVAND